MSKSQCTRRARGEMRAGRGGTLSPARVRGMYGARRSGCVLALVCLLSPGAAKIASAQETEPMEPSEIRDLLQERVPSARVADMLAGWCVEGGGTARVFEMLAAAGATGALLRDVERSRCVPWADAEGLGQDQFALISLNRHFGIRVAVSDDDYIVAGINGNGSVRLARWTGSQWVYPADWERTSVVRTGLNARNRLAVRIDGRQILTNSRPPPVSLALTGSGGAAPHRAELRSYPSAASLTPTVGRHGQSCQNRLTVARRISGARWAPQVCPVRRVNTRRNERSVSPSPEATSATVR